jgi:glycerate 2-kinase
VITALQDKYVPTVLVAPDKFRGSLTAHEACGAIARGVLQAWPAARVIELPIADGGEGTIAALAQAGAHVRSCAARDPIGRWRDVEYAVLDHTAFIETSQACGLRHVTPGREVARSGSTAGVGDIVLHALDAGCREVVLCLGGSATTDGGAGFLEALGVQLRDAAGDRVPATGGDVVRVASLDMSNLHGRVHDVRWRLATDVMSPLVGTRGAAHVFGPQKGADPATVHELDVALRAWADLLQAASGVAVHDLPGLGASGGLGAPAVALLGADVESGSELILDVLQLDQKVGQADVVITGEGQFDVQSLEGKGPAAVAAHALAQRRPVLLAAGRVDAPAAALADLGIGAVCSIESVAAGHEDSMTNAAALLAVAVSQALREWPVPLLLR